ncbi:hypothetical protein [Vibrio jasicida]|uniref:hypothetical protein n=1 Tax=Vibrio jasicida TaxID=766224 RepID=UPI00391F3130
MKAVVMSLVSAKTTWFVSFILMPESLRVVYEFTHRLACYLVSKRLKNKPTGYSVVFNNRSSPN